MEKILKNNIKSVGVRSTVYSRAAISGVPPPHPPASSFELPGHGLKLMEKIKRDNIYYAKLPV
jgi:hypothetical protein